MPKYDIQPEKQLTIRGPGKVFRIAAWKYYEIVDELRSRGIEQEAAYAAAKWAALIRDKGMRVVEDYILKVE